MTPRRCSICQTAHGLRDRCPDLRPCPETAQRSVLPLAVLLALALACLLLSVACMISVLTARL